MKRFTRAVILAGLATAVFASPALRAQEEGAAPGRPEGRAMNSEKLKERLGLTDEQAAKLKAAVKARQEAVKPLQEALKAGMKKLAGQVKGKASDSDIQASLDQLEQARKQLTQAQEKFRTETESFLTPTQRAKILLGMAQRLRQGGNRRGGKSAQESHEAASEEEPGE
jgi:Spy/CpxP family protein refolding chaperone